MKRLILILAVIRLLPGFAFAGSMWNDNHTEPVYNARTTVTKTAAYTATASDHVILVNANGAARTITLPAASGADLDHRFSPPGH